MAPTNLGDFIRTYLERVVNRHDLAAIDELVSPDYWGTGPGWPTDLESLCRFYAWQAQSRPDWRIHVEETVEVGDHVAVHAYAGGTISHSDGGQPLNRPFRKDVEWLAVYRIVAGRIAEVHLHTAVDRLDQE